MVCPLCAICFACAAITAERLLTTEEESWANVSQARVLTVLANFRS